MKTTILLFALILGYITPTYSQLNRHHKPEATAEQFQNKKNVDFGSYKFADKFGGSLSDSFDMSPTRYHTQRYFDTQHWTDMSPLKPAPRVIYSGDDMPCFKPKGNYLVMPCVNPKGIFSMRVYTPESIIWGTLW